jgi:phage terminase large subunit-like protein
VVSDGGKASHNRPHDAGASGAWATVIRFRHRVDRYAHAVDDGRIVAGPLVRLACDRHLRDRHLAARKSGHPRGFFFHVAAADHVIEFFERVLRLPDTLDPHGEAVPFLLTPANTFIVGSIFGWKMPDGYRRILDAYVEEGKGNAKTPVGAGIGLYGMTMDGEQAAECYSVATGIEQARICWLDADRMVEASPELLELVRRGKDNLSCPATYSWFRPLSKEKRGKSGPRPHFVILDEMHEYADAVVVNKMRAGMKRRRQPLSLGITNAGFDRTSICWQHHEHARQVLEGTVEDDRLFAYVCALDKDDDPLTDKSCHIKANPNLGIVIQQEYLDRQVANARHIASETNTVLRLNFCVWNQSHEAAWNMAQWRACEALPVPTADELLGASCWGGLDLGQTDDFAAWARLWELADGRCFAKMRFWLPRAAVKTYPDRPYLEWERAGLLTLTEGDTTDIDLIEDTVLEDARADGVLEIAYDKRFAQQLALHLQGAGLTMVDTPQGYALNEAIKSLAKLIVDVGIAPGRDLILGWMMDNSVLRHGRNKEVRLDKDAAKDKIDGPVALVMANARRIVRVPEVPAEDPDLVTA